MSPPQGTGPAGKQAKTATTARFADVTAALGEVYHNTSKWNACALPFLGTMLLCFALTLIVLGATYDIEDLIIIGSIFIVGSLIFFVLLYLNVIRPMCRRNQVTYERFNTRRDADEYNMPQEGAAEPLPDYGLYLEQNETYLYGKNRPVPTESQLYTPNKSRSFLATPATASDVRFSDSTPPPPRVKSPLRRMASPPPKVAMPSESHSKKKPATFDMTINEKMREQTLMETQDLELL